jgi:hypothetical protein
MDFLSSFQINSNHFAVFADLETCNGGFEGSHTEDGVGDRCCVGFTVYEVLSGSAFATK